MNGSQRWESKNYNSERSRTPITAKTKTCERAGSLSQKNQ
jgi:hypothetical protein